jgi:hypothetical protein
MINSIYLSMDVYILNRYYKIRKKYYLKKNGRIKMITEKKWDVYILNRYYKIRKKYYLKKNGRIKMITEKK